MTAPCSICTLILSHTDSCTLFFPVFNTSRRVGSLIRIKQGAYIHQCGILNIIAADYSIQLPHQFACLKGPLVYHYLPFVNPPFMIISDYLFDHQFPNDSIGRLSLCDDIIVVVAPRGTPPATISSPPTGHCVVATLSFSFSKRLRWTQVTNGHRSMKGIGKFVKR